jgi:hypothetical protein
LLVRILVDPSADTTKAEEFTDVDASADAARVKLKEAKRDSADNGALIVVSFGLSSFLFFYVLEMSVFSRLTRSWGSSAKQSVRRTFNHIEVLII